MIRYPIAYAELEKRVKRAAKGWLENAASRLDRFRSVGRYDEESSIWSRVKPVYMELQGGSKCAYCERKLEAVDLGKAEQDVEHFRPKASVKAWRRPKGLDGVAIAGAPPEGLGYFLLSYHLFNYCAACKPCNSALKKDYFPIAGRHVLDAADPRDIQDAEQPYLLYPVGDFDDDPEAILTFHGVSPQPVAGASARSRARALVTIAFFRLDDQRRKNLLRERAAIIVALYPQLRLLSDTTATKVERETARDLVDGFTNPTSAHTNCARSFVRLFQSSREEAAEVFGSAAKYIKSKS